MKPERSYNCGRCRAPLTRRKIFCADCAKRVKHERKFPQLVCTGCGSSFGPRRGVAYCIECRPIRSRCPVSRRREKEARWEATAPNRSKAAIEKAELQILRQRQAAERKTAREAKRAAEIAAKPWLASGLSVAEKRRIRYRCDPLFNLAERVRIQMRNRRRFKNMEHTIRKAVAGKVTTPGIEKFVGYTMADLRKHLEAQFDDFMSWEIFADGSIHIDHRRPVSSFDLDDPDQVRECWALSNLQPLWRPDNMRKGAN